MDLLEEFEELKLKIDENGCNLENAELSFSSLQQELLLCKDKIEKYKFEVEKQQEEIFLLESELQTERTKLKEANFNGELARRKADVIEGKLKAENEQFGKIVMRDKLRGMQLEDLTEVVEKLRRENVHLLRENQILNEKVKSNDGERKELLIRQNNCNVLFARTQENLQKLEAELSMLAEQRKSIDYADEFKLRNQMLVEKLKKVQAEKSEAENQFAFVSSKLSTLENLLKSDSLQPVHQIVIQQFKKQIENYEQQVTVDTETIKTLSNQLNQQVATNLKIVATLKKDKTEEIVETVFI